MPEETAPRFSIVVPAYNAAATLAETLDALLRQTYSQWEALVVDDGSADETLRIASEYAARDSRIQALYQANEGTAGAYNTGVSAASGEFVVMCSADDVLLPEHLQTFSVFIDRNPGYDIYSSNGYYWRPDEGRYLVYDDRESEAAHSKTLADVIRVCFYSVGAAYRRELFATTGGYRPGVFGEDYDFWLRSMANGARHRYLPDALSLFRINAGQKSSSLETMYRSDIRLVSELRNTYALSDAERKAVDDSIRERERLIGELHGGVLRVVRTRVEPIAVRLLGRARARRGWHRIRALARKFAGR